MPLAAMSHSSRVFLSAEFYLATTQYCVPRFALSPLVSLYNVEHAARSELWRIFHNPAMDDLVAGCPSRVPLHPTCITTGLSAFAGKREAEITKMLRQNIVRVTVLFSMIVSWIDMFHLRIKGTVEEGSDQPYQETALPVVTARSSLSSR